MAISLPPCPSKTPNMLIPFVTFKLTSDESSCVRRQPCILTDEKLSYSSDSVLASPEDDIFAMSGSLRNCPINHNSAPNTVNYIT